MARPLGRYQYFPENVVKPKDSAAEAVPDKVDDVDKVDDKVPASSKPAAPKKD
jgi:hypothetical protein